MGLAEQPDPRLTALVRRVVIVGAGIVGTALAAYLGERSGLDITVLERGPGDLLLGSTGHAPGFLGLLNEVPVATELARTSSDAYERLEHRGLAGFDRVGGLEVATSSAETTRLEVRAELAGTYRLPAQILTASQAADCAPSLVDRGACIGGVLYPHDGTARANVITAAYKVRAMQGGATFVHDAAVTAISVNGREVRAVGTVDTQFHADDIVIACGVWGPMIAALVEVELPLTPVAHPYVYGPDVGGNLARDRSCAGRSTTSTLAPTAHDWGWALTTISRDRYRSMSSATPPSNAGRAPFSTMPWLERWPCSHQSIASRPRSASTACSR